MTKILGPSVILAGLGVGSGEYIIWPFITSAVGPRLPVGRRPQRDVPVLHQHGDRAVHAGHRRDGDCRVRPALATLGLDLLSLHAGAEHVAGLGDRRRHRVHVPCRWWQRWLHHGRGDGRHRLLADDVAGRVQDAGARAVLQGRADARLPLGGDRGRHRTIGVGRSPAGGNGHRHAPGFDGDSDHAPAQCARVRRRRRRQQPRAEQLDPRQGFRDGRLHPAHRVADYRRGRRPRPPPA